MAFALSCLFFFLLENSKFNEVWWQTPEIPTLEKQKQEDPEFEASLENIVRPYLKTLSDLGFCLLMNLKFIVLSPFGSEHLHSLWEESPTPIILEPN
jgi:hypothetical protein